MLSLASTSPCCKRCHMASVWKSLWFQRKYQQPCNEACEDMRANPNADKKHQSQPLSQTLCWLYDFFFNSWSVIMVCSLDITSLISPGSLKQHERKQQQSMRSARRCFWNMVDGFCKYHQQKNIHWTLYGSAIWGNYKIYYRQHKDTINTYITNEIIKKYISV